MASNTRKIQINQPDRKYKIKNFLLKVRKNENCIKEYLLWKIEPRIWLEVYSC